MADCGLMPSDTENCGMLGSLIICLRPLASLYKRMRDAGHPTELVSLIADCGLLAISYYDCRQLTLLSKQIAGCWPLLATVYGPLASFRIGCALLAFREVVGRWPPFR